MAEPKRDAAGNVIPADSPRGLAEPRTALGVAKTSQLTVTPEEVESSVEEAHRALTDRYVRDYQMSREQAAVRADADLDTLGVMPDTVAPGRARSAMQDRPPEDVIGRTIAPIARKIPGAASSSERDEKWRNDYLVNLHGLDKNAAAEMVKRAVAHPPEIPAEDMPESPTSDIVRGLGKVWDAAGGLFAPVDTAARVAIGEAAGADVKHPGELAVEGVQDMMRGIAAAAQRFDATEVPKLGIEADQIKKAIEAVDPTVGKDPATMTKAEAKAAAPVGIAGVLSRAIVTSPIAPELMPQLVAALDGDAGTAMRYRQFMIDARPDEHFDTFAEAIRGADPNDAALALDDLAPDDIPDPDTSGGFSSDVWRRALEERRADLENDPAFAEAYKRIDNYDGLYRALRQIPYKDLQKVQPNVGPTVREVLALADRRKVAQTLTGKASTDALMSVIGQALLRRTKNKTGEDVYIESEPARLMRLAGPVSQGMWEADVQVGQAWPLSLWSAAADEVGAEHTGRLIRELRIPTQAGLDHMLATDAWQEQLKEWGAPKYTPLRAGDPGGWTSWLARVATDIQNPEYLGPGYSRVYVGAGGDRTGAVGQGLSWLDVGIDFLSPGEEWAINAAGGAARAGTRAYKASQSAPRGARGAAANAAAWGGDAYEAVGDAVERASREAHARGDVLTLPEVDQTSVRNVLAQVTDSDVEGAVRDEAARTRQARIDTAQRMLDQGATPDTLKLRNTGAWKRRRAEIGQYVTDGKLTEREGAVAMLMMERHAFRLAEESGEAPEAMLGRVTFRGDGETGPEALFQGGDDVRPRAPTFYSALRRAVEGIKQEKLTADQLRATLRNAPGVKADEIEWTGLDRFLAAHPKPTRADVLAWLDENAVVVEEKQLGGRASIDTSAEVDRLNADIEAKHDEMERLSNFDTMKPDAQALAEHKTAWDALVTEVTELRMEQDAAAPFSQPWHAWKMRADGVERRMDDLHKIMVSETIVRLKPQADAIYDDLQRMRLRRRELMDAAEQNRTQYDQYNLPGGANYREVLFRLPEPSAHQEEGTPRGWGTVSTGARYNAPHFGDEGRNLLAHVRLNDRVGPNGEKILHIEEIQSDWHQAGREKGYSLPDTPENRAEYDRLGKAFADASDAADAADFDASLLDASDSAYDAAQARRTMTRQASDAARDAYDAFAERLYPERRHAGPPAAPFAKTWHELVMKRVLREAAEGGYDGVSWTTGVQQVDRYTEEFRQKIDSLDWRVRDDAGTVRVYPMKGGDALTSMDVWPDGRLAEPVRMPGGNEATTLEQVVGKDAAAKVLDGAEQNPTGSLKAADLTIGGEGMKGFYDKILPEWVNKYVKRWGARVGETSIVTGALDYDAFKMRARDWRLHGNIAEGDALSDYADRIGRGESPQVARHNALRFVSDESRDGVSEEITRLSEQGSARKRIHYLPITDQIRNAVLHEGQPLFQRSPTGAPRGSIEPVRSTVTKRVIGHMIRLFDTADFDTFLHEDGHLLTFLLGDKWRDVFDLTTREGHEGAAETLRYWFRGRVQPNGKARAVLDRLAFEVQNLWLGWRGQAMAPPGIMAQLDAAIDPGSLVTTEAVKVSKRARGMDIPVVYQTDEAGRAIVGSVPPREGRKREFARIDTAPAHVRAALGIANDTAEIDPVDLWHRAMAYVVVEKYKQRGVGDEALVTLTSRTAVPKSRAPSVLSTVQGLVRGALGGKEPSIDGDVMVLTPDQVAGVNVLVGQVHNHAMNVRVPDRLGERVPVPVWNAMVDGLIDMHAGRGARRNTMAEEIVTAPLLSSVVRMATAALAGSEKPAVEKTVHALKAAFSTTSDSVDKMGPEVREAWDATMRAIGSISEDLLTTAREIVRASDQPVTAARLATELLDRSVSAPVHPQEVQNLVGWTRRFDASGDTVPTLDDIVPDLGALSDAFDNSIERGVSETESQAIIELTRANAERGEAPWGDYLDADPVRRAVVTDAVAILDNGVRRRMKALDDATLAMCQDLAGSEDEAFASQLHPELRHAIYRAFWAGDWETMFNIAQTEGQLVVGESYNQLAAVSGMIARARARQEISRFADRLLDLGITAEVDRAIANGQDAAATYAREIGSGYTDKRARVLAWLNRIVSFKSAEVRDVGKAVEDGETVKVVTKTTPPGGDPFLDINNPDEREAYMLAHRLLAQMGWKFGKGTFGDVAVVLPNGEEVFMPAMIFQEIKDTMDRAAKVGVAFADSRKGGFSEAFYKLSEAVARNQPVPSHMLNLSAAHNEPTQITPMVAEQAASRGRRRAAQVAGMAAGAGVGFLGGGVPGAIVGGIVGRTSLPYAIEAGGMVGRKVRESGMGALNVVAVPVGAAAGAALGALHVAIEGLRVAFPLTLAMGRIGMTSGLVLPHPAFFVGNTWGAGWQTFFRTGIEGSAGATRALGTHGHLATYLLAQMSGEIGQSAGRFLNRPPPLVDRMGRVHTPEALLRMATEDGLSSSYVKSESSEALVTGLRRQVGTWTDKLMDDPFTLATAPLRAIQQGIMEAATAIDNANRVAVWLDHIERGVARTEAARIARDAAFDYGRLSDFERAVLRNVVLFYSYQRQSLNLFWWTLCNEPHRVLAALRLSRGLRYKDTEDPDAVLGVNMDTRLSLFFREAQEQNHAKQGVLTVSPPVPIDFLPLWADILGAWQGDADAPSNLISRLTPAMQAPLVLGLGVDPFSRRGVDDYNDMPPWLLESGDNLTGGLLSDVLDPTRVQERDPVNEDYPGAYRYQAQNGKAWWVLRTLVQVPPFGRSMDTLGAVDRWAPGGGRGPIQAIVDASRRYRDDPDADWDAFFAGPVRGVIGAVPVVGSGVDTRTTLAMPRYDDQVEDAAIPRPGLTRSDEAAGLFGFKPVQPDTPGIAAEKQAASKKRRAAAAIKRESAAEPQRQER